MKMPDVVHPVIFNIKGHLFRVVSYVPLTNQQAERVALAYHRRHKPKKKIAGKIIDCITLFDERSSGLL